MIQYVDFLCPQSLTITAAAVHCSYLSNAQTWIFGLQLEMNLHRLPVAIIMKPRLRSY